MIDDVREAEAVNQFFLDNLRVASVQPDLDVGGVKVATPRFEARGDQGDCAGLCV